MRSIFAGLMGLALAAAMSASGAGEAVAASASPGAKSPVTVQSDASPVTYYGYSRYRCYGYRCGGYGYRRSYRRHGYGHGYYHRPRYSCSYWKRRCVENWGYYAPDINGCLRYHGCW